MSAPDPRAGPSRGRAPDAREAQAWRVLRARFLTAAGNVVGATVAGGATTLDLTWDRAQPSTTYGVCVTPSWDTTAWVTSKTTAGCTVHFGTAPGADSPVDVLTYQP